MFFGSILPKFHLLPFFGGGQGGEEGGWGGVGM